MVVAFTVLLVVLVATAALTITLQGQAATTNAQVSATSLADQALTELGNEPLTTLQSEVNDTVTEPNPVHLGGDTFVISHYLHWDGTGAAPSLCLSGNPPQVLQATVTVSWAGAHHVAETAVIDPPYGAAQSQDGWLSVLIQSAANANDPPLDVAAVSVVITPAGQPALTPATPGADGCVYMAVPPGTYSVSLVSPAQPAFVDADNDPAPSLTGLTVTQGHATDADFLYDQAAQVTFSATSTVPLPASGMPITVANSIMTNGSQVVVAAGSTSDGPVALFPAAGGYQAWFGDCPSETPGTGWTGETASSFDVSPGQTTTVAAGGLVTLELAVATADPVSATATTADPDPSACPTETYGMGQGSPAGGTALIAAQIIPEDYQVTVTDQSSGASTVVDLSWDPTTGNWVDASDANTQFPPSTPIPVAFL